MNLSLIALIFLSLCSTLSIIAAEEIKTKDLIIHKYFINDGDMLKISIRNLDVQPPKTIRKLIKLKDPTPLKIHQIRYKKSPYLFDINPNKKLPKHFIEMGNVIKVNSSYFQYIKIHPVIFLRGSKIPMSSHKIHIKFSKIFSITRPSEIKKDWRLLLLIADKFKHEKCIEDYILHKKRMGLTTEVKYITPDEWPESIKTFIINNKRKWRTPPLRYVVIIGTSEEIKTLKLVDKASDHFYQHLDLNKQEIDAKFSPPDISLGRIPISNPIELREHIESLIKYESGNFRPTRPFISDNFFKIYNLNDIFHTNTLPYVISDALIPGIFVDKQNQYSEIWLLDPYGIPHFFGGNNQSYLLKESIWNSMALKRIYSTSDLNEVTLQKRFNIKHKEKESYFFYEIYNLLGDPSIQFFTDTPQKFSISIENPIKRGFPLKIKLKDEFGRSIPFASVFLKSLSFPGFENHYFADLRGEITINNTLDFPEGNYELSAKFLNFKLTTQNISIETPSDSLVSLDQIDIIKNETGNQENPSITIRPYFKNVGDKSTLTQFDLLINDSELITKSEISNSCQNKNIFTPGKQHPSSCEYKIFLSKKLLYHTEDHIPITFIFKDDKKRYQSTKRISSPSINFTIADWSIYSSDSEEKIVGPLIPGKDYFLNLQINNTPSLIPFPKDVLVSLDINNPCITIKDEINRSPSSINGAPEAKLPMRKKFNLNVDGQCKQRGLTEFQFNISQDKNSDEIQTFVKTFKLGKNLSLKLINDEQIRQINNSEKIFTLGQKHLFHANAVQLCTQIESRNFDKIKISLTSPANKHVVLHNYQKIPSEKIEGCFGVDISTIDPMSNLNGEIPKGEWRLHVTTLRNPIDFKMKGFYIKIQGIAKEKNLLYFSDLKQKTPFNNMALPGKFIDLSFGLKNVGTTSGDFRLFPPRPIGGVDFFEMKDPSHSEVFHLSPGEKTTFRLNYYPKIHSDCHGGEHKLIIPYKTSEGSFKELEIPISVQNWDYRIHLAGLENLNRPKDLNVKPGDRLRLKYRIQNLTQAPATDHFLSVHPVESSYFKMTSPPQIIHLGPLEEKTYAIEGIIAKESPIKTQIYLLAEISDKEKLTINSKEHIGPYLGETFHWENVKKHKSPFQEESYHRSIMYVRNDRNVLGLKVYADLDTDAITGLRLQLISPNGTTVLLKDFHEPVDKIHGIFGKEIPFHDKLDTFQHTKTRGMWSLLIEKKSPLTYVYLKKWKLLFHTQSFEHSKFSIDDIEINDERGGAIPVLSNFKLRFFLRNEEKSDSPKISFKNLPPYIKWLSTVNNGCDEHTLKNGTTQKCSGYYLLQMLDPKKFGNVEDHVDISVSINAKNFNHQITTSIALAYPHYKIENIHLLDSEKKSLYKIQKGKRFSVKMEIVNDADFKPKYHYLRIEYPRHCLKILSHLDHLNLGERELSLKSFERSTHLFQFEVLENCHSQAELPMSVHIVSKIVGNKKKDEIEITNRNFKVLIEE